MHITTTLLSAVSGKVLILMGTEKDATGMFSGLKLEPDGLRNPIWKWDYGDPTGVGPKSVGTDGSLRQYQLVQVFRLNDPATPGPKRKESVAPAYGRCWK